MKKILHITFSLILFSQLSGCTVVAFGGGVATGYYLTKEGYLHHHHRR